MMDGWLADIVVVNESRDQLAVGDVSLFRSAGEACSWLEHWWVQNDEGFAFTAVGDHLVLGVSGENRVIVASQQTSPGGQELVSGWLRATAISVLDARRARAERGSAMLSRSEELGQLPTSVEGLIAYIGFTS